MNYSVTIKTNNDNYKTIIQILENVDYLHFFQGIKDGIYKTMTIYFKDLKNKKKFENKLKKDG